MSRNRTLLIIFCYIIAALLVYSDLGPLYDTVWKPLDIAIFKALNGLIATDGPFTKLMIFANSRLFDKSIFVLMMLLCVFIVATAPRGKRVETTARLFAITLSILLAMFISKAVLDDMPHPSPGAVLSPYHDLNTYISGYTVKTSTERSFPGDHAMTSALFAAGLLILFRRRYVTTAAFLLFLLVTLPRLIGGGHWFTDALIGSLAACLVLLPWLIATPIVPALERLFQWGYERLPAPLKGKESQ